jgi:hypothetical protein
MKRSEIAVMQHLKENYGEVVAGLYQKALNNELSLEDVAIAESVSDKESTMVQVIVNMRDNDFEFICAECRQAAKFDYCYDMTRK